jgi:outer membrane protein assembly factor BamB
MPVLEIRRRSGRIETRELSRKVPLLVGSHESSDIHVDAAGVAAVHCRIAWNKPNYEVTAVDSTGVQWNGSVVRHAVLNSGDVLRVGDVEIVMQSEAKPDKPASKPARQDYPVASPPPDDMPTGEIALKPISSDSVPARDAGFIPTRDPRSKSPVVDREQPPVVPREKAPAEKPRDKSAREREKASAPEPPASLADRLELLDDAQSRAADALAAEELASRAIPRPAAAEPPPAATSAATSPLGRRPLRPGEQDPLKSPFVLGMGALALFLLLGAGSLWFLLQREAALEKGSYAQAIEQFEAFIKARPRHALVPRAVVSLATARIDREIAGSSPAWDRGLAALNQFLEETRDTEDYQDPKSEARRLVVRSADRIAFGAAESARDLHQRELIAISNEAARVLELNSPGDAPPTERLQELAKLVRTAEAATLQHEVLVKALAEFDEALGRKEPLKALEIERRLIDRYSALETNRSLRERVAKALATEKDLVSRDDSDRDAVAADAAPSAPRALSLIRRTRTRSDIGSSGNIVVAMAEDCCYGIDTGTGQPVWRRPIGSAAPFGPVPVAAGSPAVLLFDSRRQELLLCDQQSGRLVWRQPVDGLPAGEPLVFEGQVFLALRGGLLAQFDLNTGRRTAQLRFGQGLAGAPAPSSDGEHLYIAGNEEVLYRLKRRPLGCLGVVRLGHGKGAVEAPLMVLRSYLLVAENDRVDRALLRLFDLKDGAGDPVEIASHRIEGHVRQAPAVRGKQLFVPSVPERITAFTISETGDKRSLAVDATFAVPNSQGGPIYVSAGPDDQVWMTGTALRRLELKEGSLIPDKQEAAAGISSQPVRVSGDSIFLGRRQPWTAAVADRQRIALEWQNVLGATILGCTAPDARDGATIAVTAAGDLFRVSPETVDRGGFELQPAHSLAVPEGLTEPLQAAPLADGRLAVYCGGLSPRLWLVSGDGSAPQEIPTGDPLQSGPVSLADGLLLPLAGRLRIMPRAGLSGSVEDFLLPLERSQPPAWRGIARLGEQQAAAISETGRVSRLELRTSPVRHLAEISHWETGAPVDAPLAADEQRLVLADSSPRLVVLDSSSLEPLAEQSVELPAHGAPWIVGATALVQLGRDRLECFDLEKKLERRWSIPLDGTSLAGPPAVWNDRLVLARYDGEIILADRADGRVLERRSLGQELAGGPMVWKDALVVSTRDGSFLRIDGLFGEVK